ncbi:MAG: hypothetical protein LBV67_10225 [Streptococcaceae bacterium]|jgi:hypothetical protein|nr:hypothetical protein [Streptococcaceae bacterium]
MYYNQATNPYLSIFILDEQFREAMKAQERVAVQAILMAKKEKLASQKIDISSKLNEKKTKMQHFASQTIVTNLKEGLTGKSTQAAQMLLESNKFQPQLGNPMKSLG